ncbi:MAG TPA: DivIVA domain-containing protein [Solirubrobacteraceae bacterium]
MALDRHSIEKKDFPLGQRGYDPDAVDAHLAAVAEEIDTFKQEARRRTDTVAASASDRVRTIVEAAEHSAAEIQRAAEQDAREIREEAGNEANATRENATREAREYVEKISASTGSMLERLNAMEQEMNAMIETVRAGSDRLTADLQQLQSGFGDVSSSLSPRPTFQPEEPAPGASQVETVDPYQPQPGDLQEPQFSEHFQPQNEPAAGLAPTETPVAPEAAELASVAGEPAHGNGSDQPGPSDAEPAHHGDAEGARLIALNMALNGTPREETARYLSENFQLADAGGLLDEVYASVGS